MHQDDLIVEWHCFEILQASEVIEKISIIDRTVPGLITKALNDETDSPLQINKEGMLFT